MAQPSPELIRGIPIFADLDDASVAQLATDFIERVFEPGQEIATEGEGGLNFFVVDSGSADVSVGGKGVATLGRVRRSVRSPSSTSPRARRPSPPRRAFGRSPCLSGAFGASPSPARP